MHVSPVRRVDDSMDVPPIMFSTEPINITTNFSNSTEMRFPETRNVGTNLGAHFSRNGIDFPDAREISRMEERVQMW